MPQSSLMDTLRDLVLRHGIGTVLHSLADIQSTADSLAIVSSRRGPRRPSKNKPSAVEYVTRMALVPYKTEAMRQAAQLFDDKRFLPAIADIREFCRVHGIELPRKPSRPTSVPRVFSFLASMDAGAIVQILDEGSFSGPTRLAPIADAIRGHSATGRHNRRPNVSQPSSESVTKDSSKEPVASH